jgi:mRNA interferase RelE/StbE
MKVAFRTSFLRDLKKVKDQSLLDRARLVIVQVELASNLGKIGNLKKITGASNYFRIRVSDYRIGLVVEKDLVEFVRFLPRKDLYRFFP